LIAKINETGTNKAQAGPPEFGGAGLSKLRIIANPQKSNDYLNV